jgi:anion-transporting  ArsA/GET3 family ATPase
MLDALLSKKLVLFTGKGGVGKTTCAMAFALSAARRGLRVNFCEMGARPMAGRFFGIHSTHSQPTRILAKQEPNLWATFLEPKACLQNYLLEQLKSKRIVKLATESNILARLWEAMPSVNEMAILHSLYRYVHPLSSVKSPPFDLVVADLPSTGHALSMLRVPMSTLSIITVGNLAKLARSIDTLLRSEHETSVCVVTLAEELPVNESTSLVQELRSTTGIRVQHIFLNNLFDVVLESDDKRACFEELALHYANDERFEAIHVMRERLHQIIKQQKRCTELAQRISDIPMTRYPHIPGPPKERLDKLSECMMTQQMA